MTDSLHGGGPTNADDEGRSVCGPPPPPDERILAPAWQQWIAENLARGVSRQRVVALLIEHGVPADEAHQRIDEVERSPAFETARALGRRVTRLEQIVRLLSEHRTAPGGATGVHRVPSLSPDAFFEVYWSGNTPVVLTDVVTRWPAFGRWTPEDFADRVGDVEVEMSAGREGDPDCDANFAQLRRTIRMRDYVDLVLEAGETNDFYLIARGRNMDRDGLQVLLTDVTGPDGIIDPLQLRGGSALWFGPAGTVTSLHYDTSNILFGQVYGRKRVKIVAPTDLAALESARGLYNTLDLDAADVDGIPAKTVDLAPGEALFIPAGWWHTARALDVSISLAINRFVRPNAFPWYRPGSVR